jgi:imidazolonepropionase
MTDLVIVNCRQLVTLAGPARARTGAEMRELAVIPDGALVARDGRILMVGTRAEIERVAAADSEMVDAGGRIMLPGFVDAHTHPVFAGNRADEFDLRAEGATYAEIAACGGGIRSTVRRTREAGAADLLATARRYRSWFLRGGTTTIEAKSGYGLTLADELKILHVIRDLGAEGSLRVASTFLGAHEVPDEYRDRRSDYIRLLIEEMLPAVWREGLAESCDVFCEPSVFPVEEARGILMAARALGFRIRMHADQFSADEGSLLAAEVGADTADHLEATTERGWAALAAAGVQPVLLPASACCLGSGRYAAARQMIECGLAVTLGTDFNPGSSPTTSMPLALSLAVTQMKMTCAEAITAATINGAYSLRRGGSVGSLEEGKLADLAIHDCCDYRELAYFFGRDTARAVYIGGVRQVIE